MFVAVVSVPVVRDFDVRGRCNSLLFVIPMFVAVVSVPVVRDFDVRGRCIGPSCS
jgi:hypothetical protein